MKAPPGVECTRRETAGVREERRDAIEPAQRQRRFFEQTLTVPAQLEGRLRRKGVGNEGAYFLAPDGGDVVTPGAASFHLQYFGFVE
jgi:hypothetical protein